MNYAEIVSTLLMIIGGVTILTNIIVQVVKTVTWDKIPTNQRDCNYLVSGICGCRGRASVRLRGHGGLRQID